METTQNGCTLRYGYKLKYFIFVRVIFYDMRITAFKQIPYLIRYFIKDIYKVAI